VCSVLVLAMSEKMMAVKNYDEINSVELLSERVSFR
jgi:hypothetical protein